MKVLFIVIVSLFIFSFFIPQFIDIADFTYVKLTHQEKLRQPLYEEIHRVRYNSIFCSHNSGASLVAKRYIPIGISKKEVFNIMKRNGFKYFQESPRAKRISWDGWDKQLLMRREYSISVDFINNKAVNVLVEEWCFAL